MTFEEQHANQMLEQLYDRVEAIDASRHINRVYFHAGYSFEELVANLRGIVINLIDQVDAVNKRLDEVLALLEKVLATIHDTIKSEVADVFAKERPGMIADVVDRVLSEVSGIASEISAGNGFLDQVIYHGFKPYHEEVAGSAIFMVQPHLVRNAVMQNHWRNPSTGDWYVSQSDSKPTEGFTITRTDPHGTYISNMWFPEAGHGAQIMYMERSNGVPWVIIGNGSNYAIANWQDNVTIHKADFNKFVKPPTSKAGQTGWTWTDWTHGAWANMTGGAGDMWIEATTMEANREDANIVFSDKVAKINASKWVGSPDDALQALAILKKSDVTGATTDVDKDKFIIALGSGTSNKHATAVFFEYDATNNTIVYKNLTNDLQRGVIPSRNGNGNGWLGDFYELEGFSNLEMRAPSSHGKKQSGLTWGITTGAGGQRDHYIFAFASVSASAVTTSANIGADSRNSARYNSNGYTWLYQFIAPGQYEFKSGDFAKMQDAPLLFRGADRVGSGAPWTLEVTAPNENGDILQRLTRRSGTQLQIYERHLDYVSEDGWGAQYKPHTIGRWTKVVVGNSGTERIPSWVPNTGYLVEPGNTWYVTGEEWKKINPTIANQFPGLGGWLSVIDTYSSGNDMKREIIQEIRFNSSDDRVYKVYRVVTVNLDKWGAGGTVDPNDDHDGWRIAESGKLDGWEELATRDPDRKLNIRVNSGAVNAKIFEVKVGGKGGDFPIATLPSHYRPFHADVWGISAIVRNGTSVKAGWVTISRSTGKVYLSAVEDGTAVDANTVVSFSATYLL